MQESVATGRYNVSEVIREGVSLLEEREKALREVGYGSRRRRNKRILVSLSREELIRRMEDEEDTVLRKSAE